MIAMMLFGAAATAHPSCTLGDYISVCNFTPAITGSFRIISTSRAIAKGAGPHRLTSEYVINGMRCARSDTWSAGTHSTAASCVAHLTGGTYYHVVATTNAQDADHGGQVSISIGPTHDAPTLHSAPISIRIKPPSGS
jgi:hypothetical protein